MVKLFLDSFSTIGPREDKRQRNVEKTDKGARDEQEAERNVKIRKRRRIKIRKPFMEGKNQRQDGKSFLHQASILVTKHRHVTSRPVDPITCWMRKCVPFLLMKRHKQSMPVHRQILLNFLGVVSCTPA